MNGRWKWLVTLIAIVATMSVATYTGTTNSLFVDDEQNTEDTLNIRWGLFTLNDGFENTGGPAWDDLWNENGTTTWVQDSTDPNSGIYNAQSANPVKRYLTSDEIEASTADNISVSFWFKLKLLNKGSVWIQTYNGATYVNWFDLTSYAGGVKNTWLNFNEIITDSQYFISDFRIRFDGTGVRTDAYVDDVLVETNQ